MNFTSQNSQSTSERSDCGILWAENLRKSYGPREALKGLSFTLKCGRILGFLGPNGAGKTTAIRILTTILEPSSGSFYVDGIGSDSPEIIRSKIGVLPESLGFPKQITAMEYLIYFGRLYGQSAAEAADKSKMLLAEVGLTSRSGSLIGTYSRGMRQKLGIARTLVNDPVVAFLDEPTLGLDPKGQLNFLTLVRRIAREHNVGIILCSHALSEVEGICDDVVILNEGEVVAAGAVPDIIGEVKRHADYQKGIRLRVPLFSIMETQRLLEAMPDVLRVVPTKENSGWLRVDLAGSGNGTLEADPYINNKLMKTLIQAEIPVLSLEEEGHRLQDVFFHFTEQTKK